MSKFVILVSYILIIRTESSELCDTKSRSCTSQLWPNSNFSRDMCYMTNYKLNSTECAMLNYHYKNDATSIGRVRLKAYVSEKYRQGLFDVLFTNIEWKKALMRFSKIGAPSEKNVCRVFHISDNATVPKQSMLKYDCPWSDRSYEREDFMFEYELHLSSSLYKKFIFKVPAFDNFNNLTKIKSLEIFSYIDITDSENLHLHIQLASMQYNVTHYFVEVMRERNDTITRLTVQVLDAGDAINEELLYVFSTWNEFGSIYFTVSPINSICKENECLKSITPKYLIVRKKSSLVIGMVGASLIIFALFYGLFFWNKKEKLLELGPIKVMFIYNPSTSTHCEVVRNLARVLQAAFRLTVFVDSIDTNCSDPVSWYGQSSHIIYIASPENPLMTAKENSRSSNSNYDAGLKLIKKELACANSSKQIVVVTFPYSVNATPSELFHLQRFNLMKDFDEFSRYIKPPTPFVPTTLIIWSAQHLEMYIDLMNSIYHAEKECERLNTNVSNRCPRIIITENCMANFDATDKDDGNESGVEETLLHNKQHFNFPISDLNLSGDGNNVNNQCPINASRLGKSDVQKLSL